MKTNGSEGIKVVTKNTAINLRGSIKTTHPLTSWVTKKPIWYTHCEIQT